MLKPLSDRVIVRMIEANETTKSGILLTASSKEKSQIAEVLEVGPGGIVDGNKVEMCIKKGERVLLNKYAGNEIKFDGEEFIIVRQNDILAVVE